MTAATAATTTGPSAAAAAPGDDRWHSWHLHIDTLAPEVLDTALFDVVEPAVRAHVTGYWFFIRYWQRGPHLRLRVHDATTDRIAALAADLTAGLAALDAALPADRRMSPAAYAEAAGALGAVDPGDDPVTEPRPPGLHEVVYRPEYDRYGGADLIAMSERLFHASSVVTLHACRGRTEYARHMFDGLEAMAATLSAWPGDRMRMLDSVTDGWTEMLGTPPDGAGGALDGAVDRFARFAVGQAGPLRQLVDGAASRWTPWTRPLGTAVELWRDRLGTPAAARILASHLHMTQNRIGVGGSREAILARTLRRVLRAT